ncbi:hypothetical protein CXG81DRAFT_723, partial [Caulochytrium protostelioides]
MDRLTQLQNCIDKLGEHLYVALGALQRDAPLHAVAPHLPVVAWTPAQRRQSERDATGLAATLAKAVVHTVQVMDYLVDAIPAVPTREAQVATLTAHDQANRAAGIALVAAVDRAE